MVNSILSLPAAANRYVLRAHDWITANSLSNSTLRKISPTWESLGLASRKVSLGEKYYAISGGRNEVSKRGADDCKHWGRHSGCTIAGQLKGINGISVPADVGASIKHREELVPMLGLVVPRSREFGLEHREIIRDFRLDLLS